MKYLGTLYLYVVMLLLFACQTRNYIYEGKKLEGVSLVAPPEPMEFKTMQELQEVGLEWVSLMPYAFSQAGDTVLHYNLERQWWGERDEGLVESIRLAHEAGMQVMLKPHLWLRGGGFTGDLTFKTAGEWQAWERHYTAYILHHAHIADSMEVALLCIGTELSQHNKQRPLYWQQLIDTVRSVYKGKLTYAANWDAAESFPHWENLDYIGVDAYFPLTKAEQASEEEIAAGWQTHLKDLQQLAGKYQKPILFTEWGYRSISNTAVEPWRSDTEGKADPAAQALSYSVFFKTVWPQPWLAGAFLWKWYPQIPRRHHNIETDYTPQGKPAMEVIREHYGSR